MKRRDQISRALRSLKQSKTRTILTSLAIAVGAFTIALSLAAGEGARQYADKLISSNLDPQAIAVAKDGAFFGEGTSGPQEYSDDTTSLNGQTFKQLTQSDIESMQQIDGVKSVEPNYQINIQYVTRPYAKKYTATVQAYDPTVLSELAAGTLPADRKQLKENEILVPKSFLAALKLETPEKAIGKKIILHVQQKPAISEQKIQQILREKGPSGLNELAETESRDEVFTIRAVTTPSPTALQTNDALQISNSSAKQINAFTTKGTDDFEKYLFAAVIANNDTDPETVKEVLVQKGFEARTARDAQELLFSIVSTLQGIVFGFGVIALIASLFGIINTQYISVLERTREIGLMKALGMHSRDVRRLFQYEAALIGIIGGIVGSIIAVSAGTIANPYISKALNLGEQSILVFQFVPLLVLVVFLMIIAMAAGFFPARKAAKLDPIEALRTE